MYKSKNNLISSISQNVHTYMHWIYNVHLGYLG